jgi:hypothetical protein
MSVILLVAGILITGAGVVTIGYGISIYEPSLGNALIIAGTTTFSAGLILIGLAAAVGQLSEIARALRGARPPVRQGRPAELTEPHPMPPPPRVPPTAVRAPQSQPPPPRPKVEERVAEPASPEGAAQASATAIERLRSSLVRPDRKPANPADTETAPLAPLPLEPAVPPPPVVAAKGTNGATVPANAEAGEEPKKAPLDFLFRGKPREAPSESFESVWPRRGQRKDEQPPAKEPAKRPWPPETAAAEEEPRQPAILKSGVVDGMAYTLYADGSIEAQLPQGTVRFGSISELRAHIENNS